MRARMTRIAFAFTALAGIASAAPAAKPPAPRTKKAVIARGFWKVLVQPHQHWTLYRTIGATGARIEIETYDVRKVANADVARLRWTLIDDDGTRTDIGSEDGRYTQVAVTRAGLYILSAHDNDASVRAAIKQEPSESDPPESYSGTKENGGRYLFFMNPEVRIGQGPLDSDGPCEDTCDGSVTIDRVEGPVELVGNWAPAQDLFESKTQAAKDGNTVVP